MKMFWIMIISLIGLQPSFSQDMNQKVTTFLMFYGQAEEAITWYTSLIENSKIISIERYEEGELGDSGSVKLAIFTLDGREYMCIDSPPVHNFSFTPAISLFVSCESEQELDSLFGELSEGGKIYMPLDNYEFSEKFGWCEDKYGVSWQVNLVNE